MGIEVGTYFYGKVGPGVLWNVWGIVLRRVLLMFFYIMLFLLSTGFDTFYVGIDTFYVGIDTFYVAIDVFYKFYTGIEVF
jgi:hypothetical protein